MTICNSFQPFAINSGRLWQFPTFATIFLIFVTNCGRLRLFVNVWDCWRRLDYLQPFPIIWVCFRLFQPFATIYYRLQLFATFANVGDRFWLFTTVYDCLRPFATICEHLRRFANTCDRLRPFATVCKDYLWFSTVCDHLRQFAMICGDLWPFVTICERLRPIVTMHLRPFATTFATPFATFLTFAEFVTLYFRITLLSFSSLSSSVISFISHPQEVLLAQFSLYVHEGGVKLHLVIHSFFLSSLSTLSVTLLSMVITFILLAFKRSLTVHINHPMLIQCWATVCDAGPSLKHYWI